MNKTIFPAVTIILLGLTTTALCMQEQPRTPRNAANPLGVTPVHESIKLTNAINTGDFETASKQMLKTPSFPLAIAYSQIIQQTAKPDNPFYSKTNLEAAFIGPLNRNNLHYFILLNINSAQQRNQNSPEALEYFKEAENRLFDQ